MAAIGLDYQMSHWVMAFSRDGYVRVVENKEGHRRTPAFIALIPTDRSGPRMTVSYKLAVGSAARDLRLKSRVGPGVRIGTELLDELGNTPSRAILPDSPVHMLGLIALKLKEDAEFRLNQALTH